MESTAQVIVDDWFTVTRLDDDTWAIGEYGHEELVNSYLIRGSDRAIVFDTGTGIGDYEGVVRRLTDRPILVVTSHTHWDHTGGHGAFADIAVHEAEREWLVEGMKGVPKEAGKAELIRGITASPPVGFDPDEFELYTGEPDRLLTDGDVLELGDRTLTVLHTPGHSPGHCCLYEPDRGYLFAQDLVYEGPLLLDMAGAEPASYVESIRRVHGLDGLARVFPGHGETDDASSVLDRIHEAVDELAAADLAQPGTGVHAFDGFQIHC